MTEHRKWINPDLGSGKTLPKKAITKLKLKVYVGRLKEISGVIARQAKGLALKKYMEKQKGILCTLKSSFL